MSVGPVTVQVDQDVVAASAKLADFVARAKTALKSGNTFTEVLAMGAAALEDLLPLLQNIASLEADVKADALPVTVATAGVVGATLVAALQS